MAALEIAAEIDSNENAIDIMLLLDNSGSMRSNDPDKLLPGIVTEFIRQQAPRSRVGIVIFDNNARLALPLTELSPSAANNVHSDTLAQVNYRGALTNTSAAVERALYELRENGSDTVTKAMVLISDGIVDVGDNSKSLQADQWLRQDLAPQAAQQGVRIFGLGITEKSDYRLLQTLARATAGDYYRVLGIEDVPPVLKQINQQLAQLPALASQQPAIIPVQVTPSEAPVNPVAPNSSTTIDQITSTKATPSNITPSADVQTAAPMDAVPVTPTQQKVQNKTLIKTPLGDVTLLNVQGLLGLLLLSAIALVVALLMKLKSASTQASNKPLSIPTNQEYFPKAYLIDLHGMTDKPEHALDHKYNLISRVDPDPDSNIHYITIKKSAISRRHALIKYYDMSFWLIDQRSVNGTFINGDRIYDEVRLKHGDRIKFHAYEFEFSMADLIFSNETSALSVQQ